MNKVNTLIFGNIFYISGIFINNFFENIFYSFLVLIPIGLFFFIILLNNKKLIYVLLICILTFSIGIFISNYNLKKIEENRNFINKFYNKNKIVSEIISVKQVKNDKIVYKGKILTINGEKPKNIIFSEIFIKDKGERLKKGQIIENNSKIYTYKSFGGFNYKNYMISNGFYFKQYTNNYKKIGKNKINIIEEKIIDIRIHLLSVIEKIYPKNESIFLGGILLGAREELPEELKKNFNNSGLTHFIAVSGFNITILIIFFSIFIKYLPKYIQIILMSIIIFLFSLLVGFSAPVIRAAIMGFIGYFVLQSGRQGNILAISLLTLGIMVTFNPFSINYDISLHLSFLAVLGIIYTEKFFNNLFKFLPNIFEIRQAISITLSALVFTLPVMVFNFGQLSLISPISNLLVSWSIPIAMLLGFTSIILYLIFPQIGIIVGFFTFLLLKWDITIVNFFGSIDFLVIKTNFGIYKGYYEIIYLVIMTFIIIYFKKKDTN